MPTTIGSIVADLRDEEERKLGAETLRVASATGSAYEARQLPEEEYR